MRAAPVHRRISLLKTILALGLFFGQAAFADGPEPDLRPTGDRIRDLFVEERDNADGTRTLRIHSVPVRYEGDDGRLHPVDLTPRAVSEDGVEAVRVDRAPVRSTVRRDGGSVVEYGDRRLEFRPDRIEFDGAERQRYRPKPLRPQALARDGSATVVREAFDGVDVEYRSMATGLKENVVLPEGFRDRIPEDASELRIRWHWRGPGLSAAVEERDGRETVVFRGGDGTTFRLGPVTIYDADGNVSEGTYGLDAGFVTVKADAAWLRDPARAYPVVVDPTVQLDDVLRYASLNYYSEGGISIDPMFAIQFDLTDVAGTDVLSAVFKAYCYQRNVGTSEDIRAHVSTDTWDESTSANTVRSWALNPTEDTTTVQNADTWYGWDVTSGIAGAVQNGAAKATIVIERLITDYTHSFYTALQVWGLRFRTPEEANAPYLEIVTASSVKATTIEAHAVLGGPIGIRRSLTRFALPELDVSDVAAAYFVAANTTNPVPPSEMVVNAHTLVAQWNPTDPIANLTSLALGDAQDTQAVAGPGEYAWDITTGVLYAYTADTGQITVSLDVPAVNDTFITGATQGSFNLGSFTSMRVFTLTPGTTPYIKILLNETEDPPGPATNPRVGGSASNPVYTTDTTPTLSWTAPTSGGDPTGYKVYVDGVLKTTVAHPTTSYTVSPALTANGNLHSWSVVATNDGGDGPSMTGNGFRVGTAPSTVSLLTPAAGAYTTDRTPDFDWSDATGTAPITYDFHFNGSAVTGSTNLSTSAFTPTTDLAYGAGTWRVIAKNAYGQSQTGNRTVNIGTIPSTFSLTAPATGTKIAVASQSSVNLDWGDSTASGGATATVKYDLQINRGSGFVTEKAGLSASATTLSGLANGALPAGSNYTWRVRAFNNYGQRYSTEQNWTLDVGAPPGGAPSAFQITGGHPSTTANPNYLTSNTFQVTWTPPTPGTGTTRYKVRVDGGAETDSASGGTAASYTAGPFSGNASHVVEVRAYNDYGTLGYVVGPTVWVNGVVPSAPSITAPTSNAKWTDTTPTYTWTAPGTGTAPFTYHVRLDGEGSDRYAGGNLTYTEPTPLSLGAHTVSVAASNLYGKGPAASVNFSLGVAPSAASLVAPATGVKVDRTTQNLSFSWTAPSTGTSPFQYRVLVDRGEGYVAESEYLSTPSWSLSESIVNPVFDANGTYKWRVEASNGYGTPSLSAERTVLIGDKPSAVAITGPGDGAYVTENAPTFTWTADPGSEAPTYAVWVDGTQQVSGLAVTSWKRGSAYSWNTHTGYVVATNGYGSSQSAVVTFHLGTIPGAFSLVTPADGIKRERTDDVPGTDLTWGESTASGPDSAPKYEVQIDRGDGFEAEATDLEVRSFVLGDLETPLPVGVHAWRVRAYNAYGERFSGTARTLDVGDKPGPIVLVAPPDGTVTANPRPTFVWEGSDGTGATTYRLRLDESSADTYAGPLKTFTPETPFATGIHSWRVVGENEYGSRTSEPFGFTIVVPGASPAVGYWLL